MTFPVKVAPGDSVVPIGSIRRPVPKRRRSPSPPTISDAGEVVNVTGTAPPVRLQDADLRRHRRRRRPTWGTGATGGYTFNAGGRVLAPFGAERLRPQAQGGTCSIRGGRRTARCQLLYRRGRLQFGATATQTREPARRGLAGGAQPPAFALDVLLPAVRFGVFGAKGAANRRRHSPNRSGCRWPGNDRRPQRVLHTIDQLGAAARVGFAWTCGWTGTSSGSTGTHQRGRYGRRRDPLGARVLERRGHGAVRRERKLPESGTVRTFPQRVTLGRWSRPTDYASQVSGWAR
jgi:hypothetical protein